MKNEFINHSIYYIKLNIPRVEKCFAQLTEEQIWSRPNKNSNSIGNLILHLCGNVTQYIISGLGNTIDNRKRDEEFSTETSLDKKELLSKFNHTLHKALEIIEAQKESDLTESLTLQGFNHTRISAIIHVTEHLSYHVGQIAYITKMFTDSSLDFYGGINLNIKNK